MPIKIKDYQLKEKLGIKRILGEKRFTYTKNEKRIEELAICYGINGNEFRATVTDLTQTLECSKCHEGGEIYDYRLLSLKYETLEAAEEGYKKFLRLAQCLMKAGGAKK